MTSHIDRLELVAGVDLNGDGHQDLVFGENGGVTMFLGKGDGTFAEAAPLQQGSFPGTYLGTGIADFNADGRLDIVASDLGDPNAGVGHLVFYPGKGDGTFGTPTSMDLISSAPGSLATGDFNNDGKQDVSIGFPDIGFISFGNGDGTFNLTSPEFAYGGQFTNISASTIVLAADLTGTGRSDVIAADFGVGTL